jgi:hypothetical protein
MPRPSKIVVPDDIEALASLRREGQRTAPDLYTVPARFICCDNRVGVRGSTACPVCDPAGVVNDLMRGVKRRGS